MLCRLHHAVWVPSGISSNARAIPDVASGPKLHSVRPFCLSVTPLEVSEMWNIQAG